MQLSNAPLVLALLFHCVPVVGAQDVKFNPDEAYRQSMGKLFPLKIAGVSFSKEYVAPFQLETRRSGDYLYFRDYAQKVFINNEIAPGEIGLIPSSADPTLPCYATDSIVPQLFQYAAQPLGIFDLASLSVLEGLAFAVKVDEQAMELKSDPSIDWLRYRTIVRRDYWHILSVYLHQSRRADATSEAVDTESIKKKLRGFSSLKNDPAFPISTRVANAMGNKEIADKLDVAFEVPVNDAVHFEHTQSFVGASIFHAYIYAPGLGREEVGKRYRAAKESMRSEGKIIHGAIEPLPDGTETFLVRTATLPVRFAAEQEELRVELQEIDLVEEILVRKIYRWTAPVRPDESKSDFFNVDFRQYRFDRQKYVRNRTNYLNEIKNDDPVIYGFRSDAPDVGRGGKMVVTMRANCSDCHQADQVGWPTIRSFSNQYDHPDFQAVNDLFDLKRSEPGRYELRYSVRRPEK